MTSDLATEKFLRRSKATIKIRLPGIAISVHCLWKEIMRQVEKECTRTGNCLSGRGSIWSLRYMYAEDAVILATTEQEPEAHSQQYDYRFLNKNQ